GQGSSSAHPATPTKPPANASGSAAHPATPAKPPAQGATATPSHPAANAAQPQRRVQQPAPELPDEGDR
ncbi:rod shape-determining protein MreC, partial [Pseudomonas oryzihabitans]|nr:rod shape-determining protein MreC [Pseudomonas oryzihabitans]